MTNKAKLPNRKLILALLAVGALSIIFYLIWSSFKNTSTVSTTSSSTHGTRPAGVSVIDSPVIVSRAPSKLVKYIRLTKASNHRLRPLDYTINLNEIEIFSASSPPVKIDKENLKTTSSSFYFNKKLYQAYDSPKLIDGYMDVLHSWSSDDASDPGEWAQVELIKPQAISSVRIYNVDNLLLTDRIIGVRLDIINDENIIIKTHLFDTDFKIYDYPM